MESLLTSLFAFIVAIALLVTVHEFGHFWVARKFNVKVLKFSVGFGKTLFKFNGKKDNTEYVIGALPFGGYVKMLGEGDDQVDVPAEEEHRRFDKQNVYKRFAIVFAGPFVNFVFAVFAFFVMFLIGVQGVKPILGEMDKESIVWQSGFRLGDQISSINDTNTPTWGDFYESLLPFFIDRESVTIGLKNHPDIQLDLSQIGRDVEVKDMHESLGFEVFLPPVDAIVGKVFADTPAQKSGLQLDDKIVSINAVEITDWRDLVHYVKDRPNQPMILKIERQGLIKKIQITSALSKRNGKNIGILGIANKQQSALSESMLFVNQYPPGEALQKGIEKTWKMSVLTLKVFAKMLIGEASLKNISGPITIAEVAGSTYQQGIEYFLRFLAIVSLSLGIINLLPIPVLDGGHLMFYIVEMIKGSPVSDAVREFALKIGVTMLVLLMSVAIYNDINRLVM